MFNDYYRKAVFGNQVKFVKGQFFLGNVPFVFAPLDLLLSIVSIDDENLHKKLYSSVKESAQRLVQRFEFPFEYSALRRLEEMENYFSSSGWGPLQRMHLDEKKSRALVTVENSPLALALQGKSLHPVDHLMRGILAGVYSSVMKRDMDCVELACLASGAPERCEFVLKPHHEFDFSKELTRKQIEPKI